MKKKTKKFIIGATAGVIILGTTGLIIRNSGILAQGSRHPLSAPIVTQESETVFLSQASTTEQKLLLQGFPSVTTTTNPSLFGLTSDLMVNNTLVDSFTRPEPIEFTDEYTQMEGVITFRGNNYRTGGTYGIANITKKEFDTKNTWNITTGALKKTVGDGEGEWSGSCWTGQPLIVRWKDETKQAMNLYEDKKQKEDLVEVIYATTDGNIYFLDLEDGTATRDKINIGFPVKGSGSLYPSEIPLYFIGAGDSMGEEGARAFIIDLIQGKIIYEYGYDDEFSQRTDNNNFAAFDSSPLIHAETDTLIQPGENGILYTMKLNTVYDGTSVTINPDEMVKWRYTTEHTREDEYYLGMESSASIWKNYLYIADNSANLICLDLNTMNVVWMADLVDDTNGSPVFDINEEDGTAYIYISSSLHYTADENNAGTLKLFKINAATGEIVWEIPYECQTVSKISGGVQSTALVGQNQLSDLVYFTIARTGGLDKGRMVAINKNTGKEVWHLDMEYYTWSSPIALYTEDGTGYVILCDSKGNMFMIDGLTGEQYDRINLGGANIEATPAAFENTIVVGTRGVGTKASLLGAKGKQIYGVKVK